MRDHTDTADIVGRPNRNGFTNSEHPFAASACVALIGLLACLAALCAIWLPNLPNRAGLLGVDWGFWLPNLLAADYFHHNAPAWAVPWFTPSQCAGMPLHADPQGAVLSLTQALTFLVSPLRAVQLSFVAYGACGFLGAFWLARARFGCSRPASLLAAMLFALNGFYAARMMVGHLSFAPFMLVPAMAACVVGPGDGWRGEAWRCAGLGVLFAACVQAGMAVLVLPAMLCLAMLAVLHAAVAGGQMHVAVLRLVQGGGFGLLLCAGKLAAALALLSHVPRDSYPLPGLPNILQAALVAIRCVFLWPSARMNDALVNNPFTLELHEFDYRVGPVPLLLIAAACWRAWRERTRTRGFEHPQTRGSARMRLLWEALALLLLVPLALNTHAGFWTTFLKHVPLLRNASTMLRWFAAYVPPACIGAALALDRLTVSSARRWSGFAAGAAITVCCLLAGDRGFYGAAGVGVYDPAPVQASWRALATTGQVTPIDRLSVLTDAQGQRDMSIRRTNQMTQGASPLFCYDPLFGYRLEGFHQGTLHAGPVTDQTRLGARTELNLKDPACYVFPGANGCAPGDAFIAAQSQVAADLAAYLPFAFAKPWWAEAADWINLGSLAATILLIAATLRRARGASTSRPAAERG